MDKFFIPYEQALALKELGFDEPCFATFYRKELSQYPNSREEETGFNTTPFELVKNTGVVGLIADTITAPLYQQAFSFFREKYNLDVTFRKMDYGPESQFTGYYFSIYKGNELIDIHGADKKCKLYKDSETECLIKLISIVKEQKL
jgi:hypothetical protein